MYSVEHNFISLSFAYWDIITIIKERTIYRLRLENVIRYFCIILKT